MILSLGKVFDKIQQSFFIKGEQKQKPENKNLSGSQDCKGTHSV